MPHQLEENMSRNGLPQDLLDKCRSVNEKDRREAVTILLEYRKKKNGPLINKVIEKLKLLLEDDLPSVREAADEALCWKPEPGPGPEPGPHRPWKKILLISTIVLIVLFGILEITGTCNLIPGFPPGDEGGGASTPYAAVRGMFDAMKSGDIDAMVQYMSEAKRSEFTNMSDEDKERLQGMLDIMSKEFEFEIKGSEIDGETALVTIELTFMGETDEDEIELMLENGRWVLTNGIF